MPRSLKTNAVRRPRAGYTLLELLLVAGLLAAAAAIVYPTVLAMPNSYRLRRCSDDVRAMLVGIRARAMEDGVAYEFSYDLGSNTYRIRKADTGQGQPAEEESAAPVWSDVDPGSRREFDKGDRIFGTHHLEEGVKFQASSGSDSNQNQPNQQQKAGTQGKDANVIRFEPTGMATSAEFVLEDGSYGKNRFTVRGLTGAVSVVRVDASGNAKNGSGAKGTGTEKQQ